MDIDTNSAYFGAIVTASIIITIWTLPWKAVALWKAARQKDLGWFIAIFILNTMAILEILYIFVFSKKEKSAKAGSASGGKENQDEQRS